MINNKKIEKSNVDAVKHKSSANALKQNIIVNSVDIDETKQNTHNVLDFQICDWKSYHEIDGENEEKYVIQLFGRTEDDKDVCLKVTDFTPFFYVQVPGHWKNREVNIFIERLKSKVSWSTKTNPNYDYDLSKSLIRHQLVQKHNFYNFTNKKLFKFVMLVFKSHTAMKEFSRTLCSPLKLGDEKEPLLYQRFESNIEPHIRFMHINNISSCGWVTVAKNKLKRYADYSYCDHSYCVNWKYIKPSDNDDRMAPFKIMGYDIECISCDINFPQADRKTDKIIQIGITMYRYGSMNCYEQHILTLKQCVPLKDTVVHCFEKEKDLLLAYAKIIRDLRPDFKAGYNNFGFDDIFIRDRIMRYDKEKADKKNIKVEFLQDKLYDQVLKIMGKLNNEFIMENEGVQKSLTYFEIKSLKSSALGDNELNFYEVPGIISVDMMKVIQRDHRLCGYKLDNVSANFITEKASRVIEEDKLGSEYTKICIYTSSTKALESDSYIQIMVNDGYSSSPLVEGAKYHVTGIETVSEIKINEEDGSEDTYTYQCIKTSINNKDLTVLREAILNPLLKIFWTFAKDDMHHTLINKYFKEGNPKRIGQIAKYCIKDCKLVNLLMAKLEIIVSSIGMAKVCHVPLSYLFLRGQGVKIFSLVSKKCREKNFLIPVLRRNQLDLDGNLEETYEGATVITPKPGVYLSPIGVLDYSSLYPNAMREKNFSQECYVNNLEYDLLPNYVYHDVHIVLKDSKGKIRRNIDGTPKKEHHRFAQELITEEQIQIELADVFDKINQKMTKTIDAIEKQEYLTSTQISQIIRTNKLVLDSKIEAINNDAGLSDRKKQKIVSEKELKFNKRYREYLDIEKNIDTMKKDLVSRIKELAKDKKLDDNDKKSKEAKLNSKYNDKVNQILGTVLMSSDRKQELIGYAKKQRDNEIRDEKSKKYNVVNGKMARYGILPEILTELLNKRKDTNNRLANTKEPFLRSILNALQLAFKITANSLYGQTGAPTSPIFFIAIAASTAATGRERLHFAKKIVEDNFAGSEIIYGDSVTGDTPIIYRTVNHDIRISTISNLSKQWESYDYFKAGDSNRRDKEQGMINAEVWTAGGWSRIRRVIRHKTNKKIYRIGSALGYIDVTEDHSLLDADKNILKPADCMVGTKLLHGFMDCANKNSNISVKEAFIWGTFMATGRCEPWSMRGDAVCKSYLEEIENIKFDIVDNKLVPQNNVEYMSDKYKNIFKEAIPTEILNSTIAIKQSFLDGYGKLETNTKIVAQGLFYLLKSVGNTVSVNTVSVNLSDIYKLECATNITAAVIEIIEIPETNDYVYDLETVDGSFHAGVGELIVKNTDSIFINFHLKDADGNERTDKSALAETIGLCKHAAKLICDAVPKPQRIIYEKTMHPFILVAKKKYVGLLFEEDPDVIVELKAMGIVLKRRDNAPIVKIVVGGIINNILNNRDIDGAISYTRDVLGKLMSGKYPIDKFIISKNLKARYKKPATIAHKVLADRMAERDPGNKPQVNDRIPFVYVVTDVNKNKKKKKDILQGDLIEHPDFVVQNGLKIDYLYYLEHQIINPAAQILELMLHPRRVKKLFDEFIIPEQNKRIGRQSMEKWLDTTETPMSKIKAGSKTAKAPSKSLKIRKNTYECPPQKKDKILENLTFVGKTKKLECQSMQKWLYGSEAKIDPAYTTNFPEKKKDINSINKDKDKDTAKKNTNKKQIQHQSIQKWLPQKQTTEDISDDDWDPDLE